MKIFILTLGTRGDLELFLILGQELRKRGHQVILGTSQFYEKRVREKKIDWVQIGEGTYEQLFSLLQTLNKVKDKKNRTLLYCKYWLQVQLIQGMTTITTIGNTQDYFISNIKIALQRNEQIIPGASVTYDPPAHFADIKKYSTKKHNGRMIDIVAMNKQLLDPEKKWDSIYNFTGFWHDRQRLKFNPPEALRQFLKEGSSPVVVTMGSMVMFQAKKLMEIIIEALKLAEQRGIIIRGWTQLSEFNIDINSQQVFFAEEIPYDWLFPQASCIIHHGGVGTIASVLKSGKSSVILPQILCQQQFGQILLKNNLTAGMFDVDSLTSITLKNAILMAINQKKYQRNSQKWQQKILEDQGVKKAADLIETHWKQLHS